MNIFVLDRDPVKAARYQCNKHIVKMILESATMLSNPFDNKSGINFCHINWDTPSSKWVLDIRKTYYKPFRASWSKHPCTLWTKASRANYEWHLKFAMETCREYTRRYNKTHRCQHIIEWCADHIGELNFSTDGLTPFAQAMPVIYKNKDPVIAYRSYYKDQKFKFAKWPDGSVPDWWRTHSVEYCPLGVCEWMKKGLFDELPYEWVRQSGRWYSFLRASVELSFEFKNNKGLQRSLNK